MRVQCLRSLQIAAILLTLPGCKIEISVPPGGSVETLSGGYTCSAGQTCVIDVVDLFFDETFVAQPGGGYAFSHWVKKPRGLCGGNTKPCRLFTSGFEGNTGLMSLLESEEVFFLEPVFNANPAGTMFNGLTSRQLPIALTVRENAIIHVEFTYQQLGEIPPDPDCRHEISVDLSAPVNADGTFGVDVSVPAQTSESGKLQLVAFDGRLSGSLGNSEGTGRWDSTKLDIVCEKSTGKTLHNFCGEFFFPCLDAFDFQFDVERAH